MEHIQDINLEIYRKYSTSKIAKRLPSVKYSFTVLGNRNFFEKKFRKNYILKKWTEWRAKVSQCRKTERGDPLGFSTSILSQNIKKNAGGLFGEKILFEKKDSQCRKKKKGGSLWSRLVWYVTRKNRKNLFGSVR